jgi:hypothetical protein
MATRIASAIVSSPFGVLRNRRTRAGHDQPVDAVALEKLDPLVRAEHERGGRERVGQHRGGSHDGHAGSGR